MGLPGKGRRVRVKRETSDDPTPPIENPDPTPIETPDPTPSTPDPVPA